MKKILFICFYDLIEYLGKIKKEIEHFNYYIISYPLFRYAYDVHDKKDNYKDHLNEFVIEHKPDIILWWFLDVPSDVFHYVKNNYPDAYYVMFNPDDYLNMNIEMIEKIKFFDLIMVSSKQNYDIYNQYNKKVIFNPISFDPDFFFPITNEDDSEYNCDISLYSYNLFLDKNHFCNQFIYLKDFITDIIEFSNKNNKTFKIFGCKDIVNYFPNNYYGDIEYYKLNKLFNYSKINLCTHPDFTKNTTITDTEIKILGSGGLLLTDPSNNLSSFYNNNCVFIDKNNYLEQIENILNNYDKYIPIRKQAYEFSKNYTWKMWVKRMHIEISKHFFNPQVYTELYNLQLNNFNGDDLWEHWLNNIDKICYDFDIPKNFRSKDYAENNNLKNKTSKQIYLHWFLNSKDNIYFSKNKIKNKDIDGELYNTTNAILCDILKTFDNNNLDNMLDKLSDITKINPYLKMNDILKLYYDLIS